MPGRATDAKPEVVGRSGKHPHGNQGRDLWNPLGPVLQLPPPQEEPGFTHLVETTELGDALPARGLTPYHATPITLTLRMPHRFTLVDSKSTRLSTPSTRLFTGRTRNKAPVYTAEKYEAYRLRQARKHGLVNG
jgi:hypothetical protein